MLLFQSSLDPYADDLTAIHPALRLRISGRAKRMALRLDPKTGYVLLIMPKRARFKKGLEFAEHYKDWINKHAGRTPTGIPLTHGTIIPILGRDRVIQLDYNPNQKRTVITLTDDVLAVISNQEDPALRIVRYLKKLARDEITNLAIQKAGIIDKTIKTVNIRDTTTRWGSCSQDGNLSFSWRLILAPPEALDYVIAHEVAHLIHLNHKARFWALCEKLSADFKGGHGWMKSQAHSLMRYG